MSNLIGEVLMSSLFIEKGLIFGLSLGLIVGIIFGILIGFEEKPNIFSKALIFPLVVGSMLYLLNASSSVRSGVLCGFFMGALLALFVMSLIKKGFDKRKPKFSILTGSKTKGEKAGDGQVGFLDVPWFGKDSRRK